MQSDQDTYDRYADCWRGGVTQQQFDDAKYKLAADQATLGGDQANVKCGAGAPGRQGRHADRADAGLQAGRGAAGRSPARVTALESCARRSPARSPRSTSCSLASSWPPAPRRSVWWPTGDMWVAAEPKETALTYVAQGQSATVTVDAYPGYVWHGMVQSVARATDQEFSVLPAENSSGNWVKVVQRVPVRVDIRPDPERSAAVSWHERGGVDRHPPSPHPRRSVLNPCPASPNSEYIVPHRGLITICAMAATMMQALEFNHRKRRVAIHAGQPVG